MRLTSLFTAAATASAVLLLAACGSSSSSAPAAGGSSSAAAGSATASASAGGAASGKFLACMVTDTGGINDGSFNQTSWKGLQDAAAANPNIEIRNIQSIPPNTDYARNIGTFISQKCGIIVTVGFAMGDATKAAATKYPNQKFAIVDNSYSPVIPNVNALVFNTVQDGFLGGYLAAGMSKKGKVATFGGAQFPTVTIYMDGFYDGVQYYNSKHGTKVQVLGWNETTQKGTFSGDFTNQTKGQTITQTFISEGADIIFPVAGNVGLGAAKAVQQADQQGANVNMLWVDTDGCNTANARQYCKYYISSVEKGLDVAVKTAVLAAQSGSFKGGNYVGTLANGGVTLSPLHDFTTKVPAALQAELRTVGIGIASGQIQTPTKSPVS
jgi:basic membrane protein A and related proteins